MINICYRKDRLLNILGMQARKNDDWKGWQIGSVGKVYAGKHKNLRWNQQHPHKNVRIVAPSCNLSTERWKQVGSRNSLAGRITGFKFKKKPDSEQRVEINKQRYSKVSTCYMWLWRQIHLHKHAHTCTHKHLCTHTCMHAQTHTCTYTHK